MRATLMIDPIETTGLDGGSSTRSAPLSASTTPGPGTASSAPTMTNASAGVSAWRRTHHSWKWIARRPASSVITTWVSTRSSVMGSSRTPGRHRAHNASVTCDNG